MEESSGGKLNGLIVAFSRDMTNKANIWDVEPNIDRNIYNKGVL